MDIAALSMAQSLANVQNQFGVAMLAKSLDTAEQTGAGLTNILESVDTAAMERSVTPYIGSNFDMSV